MFDACGSDTSTKAPAESFKNVHVDISNMQFQPAEISVKKGDTITWTNKDMVAHDVTEQPNSTWTSGPLATGKSWQMVARQSGDYYCSIHVVMKGRIMVK